MKNYKSYNNYNGYKGYKSSPIFGQLTVIFDFTVEFTTRYIKAYRRKDQMDEAARSGKQCWAEAFLQKSLEGRLKLIGVTRGSLEELLQDFLDFLRQRSLPLWDKDNTCARKIRALVYNRYKNYNDYKEYIDSPERAANAMICLINQTNQLIDQKYRWEEERFVKEGGFRENLFKKRLDFRRKSSL
jgi:four helix bundle suffix protein